MLLYVFRRFLTAAPVMWLAITACFFVLRLAPGGPFDGERPFPPITLANLNAHYNLDKSLFFQYTDYLANVLQGDLGPSFANNDFSVGELLASGMPYTFTIGSIALIVSFVLGVLAGVVGAHRQNKSTDYIITAVVLIGLVVPSFVIAPILQLVFSVQLGWLPGGGLHDNLFLTYTMPIVVLSWPHIARISRLMRGSMIETMNSDFIRTARAKGIGPNRVLFRHAIKPALIPVISYLGPAAGYLLTGSLVVEAIFGLPGIGRYFIDSALNRDYGLVLGTVVFYMGLVLLLNLIVDISYAWLDPRVRQS